MGYGDSVRASVLDYLNGSRTLTEVVGYLADVTKVNFVDSWPENRFKFNIVIDKERLSLGRNVTRKTAERAMDLAIVLYKKAQTKNSQNPGEVQGWIRGQLASTHHYIDGIRNRCDELEKLYLKNIS